MLARASIEGCLVGWFYITAAYAGPGDLDQDIVGRFEFWDWAVLVSDFALLLEDE